jgi:uroporphyrinogen-III synthase
MSTVGPLTGYTIGITAARRREELGMALERRGARIVYGPAIKIVPLADDTDMLAATRQCIAAPPDIVVVTTGIGFRGWMEAADAWGLVAPLFERLDAAMVVTRGPKARGAVRAAGLTEAWSPESESSSEVLEYLLRMELTGRRIAVQLHGEPVPDLVQALCAAGAELVEVPVYRWVPPEDIAPLDRLIAAVSARQVDAVAFTSAPAAASFLHAIGDQGAVLDALRSDVLACCVGPVTATPLQRADIPTIAPDRPRLGALVREIAQQVPSHCGLRIPAAGHMIDIRGHVAIIDTELVPLGATAIALLRMLAHHPGRVVSRASLLTTLQHDGQDEHAIEVAIGRLRAALGDPRIVQTVVKRGYRLAYEPERAGTCAPLQELPNASRVLPDVSVGRR